MTGKSAPGSAGSQASHSNIFGQALGALYHYLAYWLSATLGLSPQYFDVAVTLGAADAALAAVDRRADELHALDEALERLSALNPRQSRVVECRFFVGLSVEETAETLELSAATVKRDWTAARAWLNRELSE